MSTTYKRILLKLSGEVLAGEKGYGYDPETAQTIAQEIKEVHELGVQIAIVLGGGNIFRGVAGAAQGFNRSTGDTVGMLATMINALLFKETLEASGMPARVLSATEMNKVSEYYIRERAIRHLEKSRITIMGGGTGNPYFTTDTAAALRAAEVDCDVLMKATKVDGVYESDPIINPDAKKLQSLTPQEALEKNIRVMDAAAFSLCMDNDIPIAVFKLMKKGNLRKCIEGQPVGSVVRKGA